MPAAGAPGLPSRLRQALGRLKGAAFGRQVEFNAVIPGTGGAVERPMRPAPDADTLELSPAAAARPADALGQAQAFSAQARGLLERLPDAVEAPRDVADPDAALWNRPARSTANRIATRMLPWLKPRPLQEKATVQGGTSEAARPLQAGAGPSDLARLEQRCADAEAVRDIARAQQVQARQDLLRSRSDEALLRERQTRQALAAADERLAAALQQLRAAAGPVAVLPAASDALAADLAVRRAEVFRHRLGDAKDGLYALQSEAVATLRSAGDARERQARLAAQVRQVRLRWGQLEERHARLASVVARAEQALAERGSSSQRLLRLVRLRALRAEAAEACAQAARRLSTLQAAEAGARRELARLDREQVPQARQQLQATQSGVSAVLQATLALAEAPDPGELQALRRAVFEQREQEALAVMTRHPPGFESGEAARRLGRRLAAAVQGMPANPSADALPPVLVMDMTSQALALVAGGDAGRAQRLLDRLQQRRASDWLGEVPDRSGPANASRRSEPAGLQDVYDLFRTMSVVPRGAEVLHLLGARDEVPASPVLQAMRAFWSADAAQQAEPDAAVRDWLAGAKQVARRAWLGQPLEGVADVDGAAYNAVRNGCLSNAPGSRYQRHNERLSKAIDQWIARGRSPEPATSLKQRLIPGPRAARLVTPQRGKTPYMRAALKRATDMAEAFGMLTHRRLADDGTRVAAGRLNDWARGELHVALARAGMPPREARAFAAAAAALADHAIRQAHPSQTPLGRSDFARIRAAAHDRLHRPPPDASRPRVLLKPRRDFVLPPLFEEIARQRTDALDALRAVADHLKLTLAGTASAGELAPLAHDEAVHRAARMARQERFETKEDIVRYFEPLLLRMQLRHRLKLAGGGAVGLGVPALPYSVPSPVVSPIFSAGYSRKKEAFFQVFMPILGMEISVGRVHTSSPEATVGMAVGPELDGVARAQASFTQKMSRSTAKTEATVLRLLRARGRDDQMRAEMLGILDSWVRWDQLKPAVGRPYAGPLEAVLARHPTVSLSELEGRSTTRSFVSKLAGGANLTLQGGDGRTYKVGPSAYASAKAERIAEWRTERGGHVSVRADQGDTAQQRVAVGAQVLSLTPANPSEQPLGPDGRHGALSGGGLPGHIDVSRDLYWNLEKHAISPFLIGGKQDGDLDRHYGTAKDMLAEIHRRRDDWIARCVETLPPDAEGRQDSPVQREKAELLLQAFEDRVKALGRTSRLCQYNVNYSMRPQASAWIDGFRALQTLATLRGDEAAAQDYRRQSDRVAGQASTWRPLMLIVREKGRDARTTGWNYLARLQRSVQVEAQRTAAQFPPP